MTKRARKAVEGWRSLRAGRHLALPSAPEKLTSPLGKSSKTQAQRSNTDSTQILKSTGDSKIHGRSGEELILVKRAARMRNELHRMSVSVGPIRIIWTGSTSAV